MIKCPQCRTEQPGPEHKYCISCGFDIPPQNEDDTDGDMEFVTSESGTPSADFTSDTQRIVVSDDLGIEQPMTAAAEEQAPIEELELESVGAASEPTESEDPAPKSSLPKLSDEQIREIEHNMYGDDTTHATPSNDHNSEQEPEPVEDAAPVPVAPPPDSDFQAIKLDSSPDTPKDTETKSEAPVSPNKAVPSIPTPVSTRTESAKPLPKPEMAQVSSGTAFFYRDFIKLSGKLTLHEGDKLTFRDRTYALKAKSFRSPIITTGGAVALIALMAVLGTVLLRDVGTGQGSLGGVVLDQNNQPYISSVTVEIPELNETFVTDGRGFFKAESVPAGIYQINVIADGDIIASDYASVFNDELTLVSLATESQLSSTPAAASNQRIAVVTETPKSSNNSTTGSGTYVSNESYTTKSRSTRRVATPPAEKPAKQTRKTIEPGKVYLAANVSGAKLKIDGKTLGAGNLTYSQISPGEHQYEVSYDGYTSQKGNLVIESGKTRKLAINLEPLPRAEKKQVLQQDDFLNSGRIALAERDYESAVSDLTRAIENSPGKVEAYEMRAQAFKNAGNPTAAHDDYVLAAEISRAKKRYNASVTYYGKALAFNEKSIPALLGRAATYFARNELIASISDFDAVTRIDRRSSQAYFGMGEARFQLRQYSKAIGSFKDSRSIDKSNPLVHQYLMLCYMAVDDSKNLKKSYDQLKNVASEDELAKVASDQKYAAAVSAAERL